MKKRQNQSNGEKRARKYENRKYFVFLAEALVLISFLPGRIREESFWLFPCLLLFAVLCIAWASYGKKQTAQILYKELDPVLYKEVMEYKRASAVRQEEKDICAVNIAAALAWQGYAKNAFQVIRQIDFKKLPDGCAYAGYTTCCHYFFEIKNKELLIKLQRFCEEQLSSQVFPEDCRKLCSILLSTVNLYLAVLDGDAGAFETADMEYQKLADTPLQKLHASYLFMLLCITKGQMKEAKKAAQDILAAADKKSRLYLVSQAQCVIRDIDAGRRNWEGYGPVQIISWSPEDFMKSGIDYDFFRKGICRDLRLRLAYTVIIPLAFLVGLSVGVYRGAGFPYKEIYLPLAIFTGGYYTLYANALLMLVICLFGRGRRRWMAGLMIIGTLYFSVFMLLSSVIIIPYYIYNTVKMTQEWQQNRQILKKEKTGL